MNSGGAIRLNKALLLLIIVFILILLVTYKWSWKDQNLVIKSASKKDYRMGENTDLISLKKILSASIDVAERGGAEVVAVRRGQDQLREQTKGKTKEGANDPVTDGDFRSHRIMYYGMRRAFPKIKVISEEHTENDASSDQPLPNLEVEQVSQGLFTDEMFQADDVAVWVDPLDATQEYTENLLEYVTTMICVTVSGHPVIGVIHRPFSKETYWGAVGHGNSNNLEALAKKGKDGARTTNKFRIMVSRSHAGKAKNYSSNVLGKDTLFDIVPAAGAGYKVLEVIGGTADVYLHVTLIKKWDLCAGNAILASVGGTMTTVKGEELDYASHSNPVNTRGVLAYLNSSPIIDNLREIHLTE